LLISKVATEITQHDDVGHDIRQQYYELKFLNNRQQRNMLILQYCLAKYLNDYLRLEILQTGQYPWTWAVNGFSDLDTGDVLESPTLMVIF